MKKEEEVGDFYDHWRATRVLGECGAGADLPGDLFRQQRAGMYLKNDVALGDTI